MNTSTSPLIPTSSESDAAAAAALEKSAAAIAAESGWPDFDVAEFMAFIDRGSARLTPRAFYRLVSELPDIREKAPAFRGAGLTHAEEQIIFLADVVDAFAMQTEQDLPYRAALDAAFALMYFHRDFDLIPDSLGAIGFVDDAAIVSTVLLKHASAFAAVANNMKLDLGALGLPTGP